MKGSRGESGQSRGRDSKHSFSVTPTFLGLVPLRFALVLEADGALVHLVRLNAVLATEALGVICRWAEQRR